MNEHTALLRAILDDPDDDLVRLVFADWLQDNGEEPFAHFIRRQVAIRAAGGEGIAAERIRYEYRDHFAVDEDSFPRADLPKKVASQDREGGFLETLVVSPATWRNVAAKVLKTEPLRLLILHVDPNAEDPLECLARKRNAALHGLRIFGELPLRNIRRLAGMESLAGLRWLSLNRLSLHREGCFELASSPHLRCLRHLDLSVAHLTAAGVTALARAEWPELRWLDLSDNRIDEKGAAALAASGGFPKLEYLRLVGHDTYAARVGEAGARALVDSPRFGGLRELDLSQQRLGDPGARVTAGGRHLGRLRRLRLAHNSLTTGGILDILASADLPELETLDVSSNLPTGAGERVGEAGPIRATKLRHLSLWFSSLGDARVVEFLRHPGMPPLTRLGLFSNDLGPETMAALCRNDTLRESLRHLDLSYNPLGLEGVRALLGSVWPRLEVLNLAECNLTGEAVRWLVATKHLPGLRGLDLSNNPCRSDDVATLTGIECPLLEDLDLRSISVEPETIESLLSSGLHNLISLRVGPLDFRVVRPLIERFPHRLKAETWRG